MSKKSAPGLPMAITGGRQVCPLCWHKVDKRDRTNRGYHLECAKEAQSIILDLLHGGDNIVFREWYARTYPGRPIPVRPPSTPSAE